MPGVFKEIPPSFINGSEGYKASDTGFVMTPNGHTHRGVLGTSREYYAININKHEYRVHRLVAAAFLEMKSGMTLVNHRNGIKTDNRVTNLEWIDAKGNARHAVETGLSPLSPGRKIEQRVSSRAFHPVFRQP